MLKPDFFFFYFSILSHKCCQSLNNSHTCVSRPVVLTVREGQSQVCVHVPPTLVQKILLNTPPDKLNKTVGKAWLKTNQTSLSLFFHILLLLLHHIFHVHTRHWVFKVFLSATFIPQLGCQKRDLFKWWLRRSTPSCPLQGPCFTSPSAAILTVMKTVFLSYRIFCC